MDPICNRIKLEHSYAKKSVFQVIWPKVEEEDPLKISPEDFLKIKDEEDITIKNEAVGDADVNQSGNLNCSSLGQQFEDHSHSNNNTILLSDEESDCNVETKCLELENNCAVVDKIDPLLPVNYDDSLDMVPKRIFLLFQENYEKTIKDLRRENEKITSVADEFNVEVLQGAYPKVSRLDPPFVKPFTSFATELKRLRKELTAAKMREKLLLSRAFVGKQHLEATRKSLKTIEQQCEGHAKAKKMYVHEIYKLKDQLKHKQAQLLCIKQLQNVIETVRKDDIELKDLKIQCAAQKTALAKARQDQLAFQKELASSLRIRKILAERSVRLNRKLQVESNSIHKIKLQETSKRLAKSELQATNILQLLNVERKKNLHLRKERDQLLGKQQSKYEQILKELLQVNHAVFAYKTVLRRKAEECRRLKVELRKLTVNFNLKELECKQKSEACKSKVCEYCGF